MRVLLVLLVLVLLVLRLLVSFFLIITIRQRDASLT